MVVAFNAEGRGTGLPGNLRSEGLEDCNGFIHQDDLKAIIEFASGMPNVDVSNIGVQTSSYGITMGAGALGRYPDLPVAYLIDGEGPHDNRVTTHYDVGTEHDLCGHWSLVTDPSPENEAWWTEREAIRYIGDYPGIYLRMQADIDHAQGPGYFRHAIEMLNAGTRPQFGGTGAASWTRMNGDNSANPINAVYPLGDPAQHPAWLPGRLSDYPDLAAVYIREVAALVSSGDTDGDAFSDIDELYVTTDRFDACPDNPADDAWPPDLDLTRSVDILDVLLYKPVVGGPYDRRFDLNTDAAVDILDVLLYKSELGKSCTNP